jgi:hypothetical protein
MTKNHSIVVLFSTFAYKNDIRNKTLEFFLIKLIGVVNSLCTYTQCTVNENSIMTILTLKKNSFAWLQGVIL